MGGGVGWLYKTHSIAVSLDFPQPTFTYRDHTSTHSYTKRTPQPKKTPLPTFRLFPPS